MAIEKIETIEVGAGGAASIEFTSIPQDGVDLLIVSSLRSEANTSFALIQFNNDTTNYVAIRLQGNGSSVVSDAITPEIWDTQVGSLQTANTFSNSATYIANYASSANKSVSIDAVSENNSSSATQRLIAGSYTQTTAITSIKIINNTSDIAQYSTASLFKIS